MAAAEPPSTVWRPSVSTSMAQRGPSHGLPPPPEELEALGEPARDGRPPKRSAQVGDRVDDLILSAVDTTNQAGATDAGSVFVIYGRRDAEPLPDTFEILENVSVPGSGSFVADRGTGRAETFRDGDEPFLLEVGAAARWYQFATLGGSRVCVA